MSHDSEKQCESYKEDVNVSSTQVVQTGVREAAERRLVRKLDFRLLPTIAVIYMMNYIDRVAISSARLQGLQADLGLSDIQYESILAILYAIYCPAQIPSNMIINYISRPSLYIGSCVVFWGLASGLTSVTKSFSGIIACRIFIGLPEAAFYPGSIYLLSRWYTRKELAFRSAIFFSGLIIANAFGTLWAAGILGTMNGSLGVAGWRWLFCIEGAITIFIGFISMWSLPDYPGNTRWLTPDENHLAQVRLAEDVGEADQDSQQFSFVDGLKMALKDIKVYVFMFMSCSQILALSFTNFFPTLTATLGYSTTNTLLIAAPPWFLSAVVTMTNARHADATGERFFHLAVWWWVLMLGYIIAISTMNTAARYFSLFLMSCAYAGCALVLVWVANSIPRPPAKRSAALSIVNGFGNLGSLAGSYIWPSKWGPGYHYSMIIAVCALVMATVFAFVARTLLVRENKRLEHQEREEMLGPKRERIEAAAKLEGITFEEAVRRRKGFRYLY